MFLLIISPQARLQGNKRKVLTFFVLMVPDASADTDVLLQSYAAISLLFAL
jgi:hypothetical protein